MKTLVFEFRPSTGPHESSSACTLHQNRNSVLWLHNNVVCVCNMCVSLCLCVWLTFFLKLAGSLACRFLWVNGPHSACVTSPAWLWPIPRETLSNHLWPLDYSGLALLGVFNPAPPKSLYLYFFPSNPHTIIPSLSVSLSFSLIPASVL